MSSESGQKSSPTWKELQALLTSYPKAPIAATVTRSGERSGRNDVSHAVVHDGLEGWFIRLDRSREFVFGTDSTVFVDEGGVRAVRGARVAANLWIKALLQGRLLAALDQAEGRCIGSESLEGRVCWITELEGLRDDGATTRLWIEATHGYVLQMEGPDYRIQVTDLAIGTATSSNQE